MSIESDFPSSVPHESEIRGRRRRTSFFVAALAVFAFVSAYSAFAMVTQIDQLLVPGNEIRLPFSAPGLAVTKPDPIEAAEDRINVLLIGLDRRPGQPLTDQYRSDSLIIVSIQPNEKRASMISFPRDLWVQIPRPGGGYMERRINEAYELGEELKYEGGAPGLLRATLEHNFGVEIDYYVVLDFDGFIQIIDAMGGIDIDIPDSVAYLYSTNEVPGTERFFELEPGRHHLSGDDALAYARYRRDSDLNRIQRQQRVIMAAVSRALSLNMLSRAPQLWDKYRSAIDTDISAFRVPGLATLLKNIGSDRIESYSLGDAAVGFVTLDGASVLRLLPDKAAPIIGRAFRPRQVTEEDATILVVGAKGATADTADRVNLYLQLQGIDPKNLTAAGTAGESDYKRPMVLYRPSAKTTARFLARWLHLEDVLQQALEGEAADLPADIVVVLKGDTKPPLVALPGTAGGAAPASRFIGAGAPPQFDPFSPPPSDQSDRFAGPVVVPTPTSTPNPFGSVPNPFTVAPTATATATAPNPFFGTPKPNPFGGPSSP